MRLNQQFYISQQIMSNYGSSNEMQQKCSRNSENIIVFYADGTETQYDL